MFSSDQTALEGMSLALAEDLLREAGEMRFVARGGSMLPAIYPGDEVIVQRAHLSDVNVGEVVLFSRQGRWFVHRVRQILAAVAQAQPHLITQGDALFRPDDPVSARELLGRVIFLVRNGEQRALLPASSALQWLLRIAVRHVPNFAGAIFWWHRLRSRFASPRRVVAVLARGNSQGSA